ncbi:hypothetical protein P8C59_000312 [Phyllachora maydis]|uniref:MARVEL domain-containing protein n=1 Tax=Phyllachora maydis TaxID=1825666 RepID=A0AAD9HX40_9PEZI|nr:hypothetical protein P8C59_000312 [Phyllachora maydis]
MGAGAGLALQCLQCFIRAIQLLCAAVVLGIYSCFLATLYRHNLGISRSLRAVEGISGAAVLHALLGLLLPCCLAGPRLASFAAIALDVCFVAAFVYVAVENRDGASSCWGTVTTVFGPADADAGNPALPSSHTTCRLETTVLIVSIIAIFFSVFSALLELALVRHRRKERRFGPSPANNYTSGYGSQRGRFPLFGRGRKNRQQQQQQQQAAAAAAAVDPNGLPAHTHPDQVRDGYATGRTRVDGAGGDKYEMGANHNAGVITGTTGVEPARYPPANYRYGDGVCDRV